MLFRSTGILRDIGLSGSVYSRSAAVYEDNWNTKVYDLAFRDINIYPSNWTNRRNGVSVRCLVYVVN